VQSGATASQHHGHALGIFRLNLTAHLLPLAKRASSKQPDVAPKKSGQWRRPSARRDRPRRDLRSPRPWLRPSAFGDRKVTIPGGARCSDDGRMRDAASVETNSNCDVQWPQSPMKLAFPSVWKCRSKPTSAPDALWSAASGSLSTSTANTVKW